MQDINTVTIKDLARDCKSIGDIQEKLKSIFKDTIEVALEAELDESLGYGKHDPRGNNSGNSRNGTSPKTLKTRMGKTEINVPRVCLAI
jgi:transposase-like protein